MTEWIKNFPFHFTPPLVQVDAIVDGVVLPNILDPNFEKYLPLIPSEVSVVFAHYRYFVILLYRCQIIPIEAAGRLGSAFRHSPLGMASEERTAECDRHKIAKLIFFSQFRRNQTP